MSLLSLVSIATLCRQMIWWEQETLLRSLFGICTRNSCLRTLSLLYTPHNRSATTTWLQTNQQNLLLRDCPEAREGDGTGAITTASWHWNAQFSQPGMMGYFALYLYNTLSFRRGCLAWVVGWCSTSTKEASQFDIYSLLKYRDKWRTNNRILNRWGLYANILKTLKTRINGYQPNHWFYTDR